MSHEVQDVSLERAGQPTCNGQEGSIRGGAIKKRRNNLNYFQITS